MAETGHSQVVLQVFGITLNILTTHYTTRFTWLTFSGQQALGPAHKMKAIE